MEPRVTAKQLGLMRHTVGLDTGETPYRNHYSADIGHAQWSILMELVVMGLMEKHESPVSTDTIFCLTDEGCRMLGMAGLCAITT